MRLQSAFNTTEKCVHCNEGLVKPASQVNVGFILLLGLCERAQGCVSVLKISGSTVLKYYFDPALWVP